MCIFITNTTYFPSSETSVKPVEEETAESAAITAPTKLQIEGHQASAGEVNGFISPSEEAPPAAQSVERDGPAVPPNTLPEETAATKQAPLQRPASLQDGQHPQKPAASPQDMMQPHPQVKAEPRLLTNELSLDSTETSILSPSSLTDSDLLEAVLDDTSSMVTEKPEVMSVNVQITESPLPNADNVTQISESNVTESGNDEASDKINHLTKTAGREKGEEKHELIVETLCQVEGVSRKHSDTKSGGGVAKWDEPDGLQSEDLPSASEEVSPSCKPEPKKQQSLFKRFKKKSNQGNLIHLNKGHVWNVSLLICPIGKLLALIPFYSVFVLAMLVYFQKQIIACI